MQVRVPSQVSPCEVCEGKVTVGQVLVFPCQYHFPKRFNVFRRTSGRSLGTFKASALPHTGQHSKGEKNCSHWKGSTSTPSTVKSLVLTRCLKKPREGHETLGLNKSGATDSRDRAVGIRASRGRPGRGSKPGTSQIFSLIQIVQTGCWAHSAPYSTCIEVPSRG